MFPGEVEKALPRNIKVTSQKSQFGKRTLFCLSGEEKVSIYQGLPMEAILSNPKSAIDLFTLFIDPWCHFLQPYNGKEVVFYKDLFQDLIRCQKQRL